MKINKIHRQVLLFILAGVICYIVSIVLLMTLVELIKVEVNLANLIASLITIVICYWLNIIMVFVPGKYIKLKEFLVFLSFSLLGLLINVTLMYLLTEFTNIWYVISKTLITGFVSVFNFTTRKFIVFQD